MRVLFVEEAQLEFLGSVAYYGRIGLELGRQFKQEVEQLIDRTVAHPDLFSSPRWLSARKSPYLPLLCLLCRAR